MKRSISKKALQSLNEDGFQFGIAVNDWAGVRGPHRLRIGLSHHPFHKKFPLAYEVPHLAGLRSWRLAIDPEMPDQATVVVQQDFNSSSILRDYSVFSIGILADFLPEGPRPYMQLTIHFPEKPMRILFWCQRVHRIDTPSFLEARWHPQFGLRLSVFGMDEVPHNRRAIEWQKMMWQAVEMLELWRQDLPASAGAVNDENKWEALEKVVAYGREIATGGPVTKYDIALRFNGAFGISGVSRYAAEKAIDRLIEKCNPSWTWRKDILPKILHNSTQQTLSD